MANDKERKDAPSSPTTVDFTKLLDDALPGLSSASLQETAKTAEAIDTVRFAFNPWTPIPNVSLSGYGFGIQYVVLERMTLIPLKTWKTPHILPRTSSFALGVTPTGGVFPAGSVGSVIDRRLQFPAESAKFLVDYYGNGGDNNIGFVELTSLAGVEDRSKFEATLLFKAVMKTPIEQDALAGIEVCLEDMPKFLALHAPKLLRRAVEEGIGGYKLPETWLPRGEAMIEQIKKSVEAATRRALDETSGVLPRTKKDLIAASKGLKDVKVLPDKLDQWLLRQFPSYSLDTDVERATRANASVTDAIRTTGEENAQTTREMLQLMQATLAQLAQANESNRALIEKIGDKAA